MFSNRLVIGVVPPVSPPPGIVSVKLTSEESKVRAGQPLRFYVDVAFDRSVKEQDALNYGVMVKVYVNNEQVKTLTYALQEGSNRWSGSFTLSFQKPGTYTVWVDATLYRKTGAAQPV